MCAMMMVCVFVVVVVCVRGDGVYVRGDGVCCWWCVLG